MTAARPAAEREKADGTAAWAAFRRDPSEANAIALIQHHIPLVRRIVRQMAIYQTAFIDMEDLMQHALMGLWTAIGRYDEARGVPFEAYAMARIRGAVHDALRRQDPLTRTERDQVKKLNQIIQSHLEEFSEAPDEETLAELAGIGLEKMRGLLTRAQPWISLDALSDEGQGTFGSLADRLPDERAPDPQKETIRHEQIARFREAFKRLPARQQKILYLYYFEDLTLKEVGAIMEVSEARVCQIHAGTLLTLRALLSVSKVRESGLG